jgi:hypothetical protein
VITTDGTAEDLARVTWLLTTFFPHEKCERQSLLTNRRKKITLEVASEPKYPLDYIFAPDMNMTDYLMAEIAKE